MEKNLQDIKAQCIEEVRAVLERYRKRLVEIDPRVWEYAQDVVRTDIDIHNIDEILGLRKFLRLMDTYEFDVEAVKDVLYDAEGEWSLTPGPSPEGEGRIEHIRGGLKIDGIYGYGHYRMTAMQVMCFAWIYGFSKWVDTTCAVGSRALLPSERDTPPSTAATETESNTIWDRRRLVTQFVLMWPRKVAKTFLGAFVQYEGLMRGERDFEGYIAANSSEQAKRLFDQLKDMVTQHEGYSRWFRITNSPQDRTIAWRQRAGRPAYVKGMTANGKTKDGLKASICTADEFGAAQRVQGKIADMEGLVNVIEGSMGPRREPLTLHTSTAGLGIETPYEVMINAMHQSLLTEMEIPLDGQPHKRADDWQGGIILRPDEWERDNVNELRTERVIRKVNPNLGVTVQPDFYQKEWAAADKDGDGKTKEVITKLYNIFASDRAVDWITGDEVRGLMMKPLSPSASGVPFPQKGQGPADSGEYYTIEDCTANKGWVVLTGMDFTNVGDDFQAATYLAARRNKETGRMEFFAQFEAWVTMEAVMANPNKNLLLQWGEEGYLHVVDKKTIGTELIVDRIVSLRNEHGCNMLGFGYDPFKAKEAVNTLRTWIASFGVKPEQLGNHIMPVSQTYGAVSPVLQEVTAMIRADEPMIRFAYSPLVPWQFQNCRLVESTDGMENCKIVKSKPYNKVDNCQALLNAVAVYDAMCFKVK